MTRSYTVNIEIDEKKLDEDTQQVVDDELNSDWIQKLVENGLENENIQADVFVNES